MPAAVSVPARRRPLAVWRDPAGRLSCLRIAVLAGLLLPAAIAVHAGLTIGFGPRPLNNLIHRTGFWALMLLIAALSVTPLSRIARFRALLDVRRMIGVGAFCYAAAHVLFYVADQGYDLAKVASEIALRLYLTIGFVALVGLMVLTATSTDAMVRRLGARRWRMLHRGIYLFALLGVIHYFQQIKADPWAATLTAGLFSWLIGYRLLVSGRRARGEPATLALVLLTVAASVLTFLGEAIGIALAFNAPVLRVLQSALEFDWVTIRPGWFVLAIGCAVVLVDLVRGRRKGPEGRVGRA